MWISVCHPVCTTDFSSHLVKTTLTHQVLVSLHYCVVVVTVLKNITATTEMSVNFPQGNSIPPHTILFTDADCGIM